MKSFKIDRSILIYIIILSDIAILLDIPVLRPFLGFIFLTLLPGFLILEALRLNKLRFDEKLVLSIGLSISFLMFLGYFLNTISLKLHFMEPLSTVPLLISINIAAFALILISYWTGANAAFSLNNLDLSRIEKGFLIVPILFPVLSIVGANLMNISSNNIILIYVLFLIPIYIAFVSFFNRKLPSRIYPLIIFLISISLVLMEPLRSSHIIGVDSHYEYYVFQATLINQYWSPLMFGNQLDACLSTSILPTIYQLFLNTNPEMLFNLSYQILISFIPIIIFIIAKQYLNDFYSFLAALLYIVQPRFITSIGYGRTIVALFFFSLVMMTLFNDRIDLMKKKTLFIVFFASCVVSHYSTTYILFFILLSAFIGLEILSMKYTFERIITLKSLILFSAIMFLWYSLITVSTFDISVSFIKDAFISLNNFFLSNSRGTGDALMGVGLTEKGLPHKIQFIFTWLSFLLIGIGILALGRRYKEMSFSELNIEKPDFLIKKFKVEYFVIAFACFGILGATVAVPYVSAHYDLMRTYLAAMTILSAVTVIGGITVARTLLFLKTALKKQEERGPWKLQNQKENTSQVLVYLIILFILIPYFFSLTGVTYHFFGYPRTITLDSQGEKSDLIYTHDQDFYNAKWLGNYAENNATIYADFMGTRLISGGLIATNRIKYHWFTVPSKIDGYIYLRYRNIAGGILVDPTSAKRNYDVAAFQDLFSKTNEISDNGYSKIYLNPGFLLSQGANILSL